MVQLFTQNLSSRTGSTCFIWEKLCWADYKGFFHLSLSRRVCVHVFITFKQLCTFFKAVRLKSQTYWKLEIWLILLLRRPVGTQKVLVSPMLIASQVATLTQLPGISGKLGSSGLHAMPTCCCIIKSLKWSYSYPLSQLQSYIAFWLNIPCLFHLALYLAHLNKSCNEQFAISHSSVTTSNLPSPHIWTRWIQNFLLLIFHKGIKACK